VAYRAEFDTEDPPLQGFAVLQRLCDVLRELGCDDEAKALCRATHVLETCSPSWKPEFEAEMSSWWNTGSALDKERNSQNAEAVSPESKPSNQNILAQMKLDAREILHEFPTYCGEETATAVEQEKFQWAQLVKSVREKITLTSQTKLEQMDERGPIVACIAGTEQIFENMLKDFGSPTCQFAYPVLRVF